jgi:hypothetical protein
MTGLLSRAAHSHADLVRDLVVARIRNRLHLAGLAEDGLLGWLNEFGPAPNRLDTDEIAAFEEATPDWLPLRRLGHDNAILVTAVGLIEEDIRWGSLFAKLQEPLAARRPCLGALGWLLADDVSERAEVLDRSHRLVNSGLLVVDNPSDPRSEWVVRVPVAIYDLLRQGSFLDASLPATLRLRPAPSFPTLDQVVVPPALAERLPRICALVESGRVNALVARGPETSGRSTLLGAVARHCGRDVLAHDGAIGDEGWQLLGPLATLAGAMAVTAVRPGPGETLTIPAFRAIWPDEDGGGGGARPLLGVVAGRNGGLTGPALEGCLAITMGAGDERDRRRMWLEGGLIADESELQRISERALLTPGNIRRAAPTAMAIAALDSRDRADAGDVRAATRTLSREALETLATHLAPLELTIHPVLAPAALEEVATLLSLCRHRERLPHYAGGASGHGGLNRGVRALFSGPSGTGKTLAARYVASQLGLDLYRVDLAAVVSKYIGETERNLDQVLGRAEELDVVLLLDEGDALMTRRTEVANANDRYANLETNFLLQRLETFEGIVIVTSNASSRIDSAFQRRIDVTVEMSPPDPDARFHIWLAHLPADHTVSSELLLEVARRCTLTGGRIRNAALHASLLALEGGRPVADDLVVAALQREYRRMGASFPLPMAKAW